MNKECYVVYGKKNCSGCDQAKALLEAKGITYEYVDVMTSREVQQMFREKGFRSVPQIFKGTELVGGFEQLKEELK